MIYETMEEAMENAPAGFPDVSGRNVYISGPIEHDADAALKFALAHRACIAGHAWTVFNPMAGAVQAARQGWTREQHMTADLHVLTGGTVDLLLMLPGWRDSEGATIERAVAIACGIEQAECELPERGDGPRAITNGRW